MNDSNAVPGTFASARNDYWAGFQAGELHSNAAIARCVVSRRDLDLDGPVWGPQVVIMVMSTFAIDRIMHPAEKPDPTLATDPQL